VGRIITPILLFLILLTPAQASEKQEYKYPSDVIYGFVDGCYIAFEDQKFMSDELWPTDLKEICGCVMDGIREAIPLQDFIKDWDGKLTREQEEMSEMFGMICTERIIKQKLRQQKDPV
tara:strand:+ start:466 stop:822 length:357 start_codon:yes stop_codon:yes gene_type:complete